MSGSRALKLALLADVSNLTAGLGKADNEVSGFGDKLGKFGKMAGAAFAAAGAAAAAYAGKLLVDGVKAAIEDEAAQKKLANALHGATGATDEQVAATEKYITQLSLATGVSDSELRPSLERLARATGDITKAQELQSLAMDVSAGTGKSLEAISNALGKAYEGNTASLGKLGLGLSTAELKSMSMEEVTARLGDLFGGQAYAAANSFQGKMDRLGVAFDEAKETVGSYVVDAVTPLVSGFVDNVIPAMSETADKLGTVLGPAFENIAKFIGENVVPIAKELWAFFSGVIVPGIVNTVKPILVGLGSAFGTIAEKIKENKDKLAPLFELFKTIYTFIYKYLAPVIGDVLGLAFKILGKAIGAVIDLVANLVNLFATIISKIIEFGKAVADSPVGQFVGKIIDGFRAEGGPVRAGGSYIVGERGPELFTPRTSGTIIPNGAGGQTVNITIQGAVDPESTARQIARILEQSTRRVGVAIG